MFSRNIEKIRMPGNLVKWVAAGLFLVTTLVVILAIPSQQKVIEYRIQDTPLSTTSFSYISGSELYAYNGLSFYKINLAESNNITVLSSGQKLPTPSSLHWANSAGALLSFKESFSYSLVEQSLSAQGLSIDRTTSLYTWYLDFANGSLKQVSDHPVKPGSALYSLDKKGFYYVPDYSGLSHLEHEEIDTSIVPLYFYNLQTGKNEPVSSDLGVTDISYLGYCLNNTVCIIARERSNPVKQRLYEINIAGEKKQLLEAERLFSTNYPELYLSADSMSLIESDKEIVDYDEATVNLRNIRTETKINLGFKTTSTALTAYFATPSDFFVLDNSLVKDSSKNESFYVVGKISSRGKAATKVMPILRSDGTPYSDALVDTATYGTDVALLTSSNGSNLLMVPKDTSIELKTIEEDKAKTIIDRCMKSNAKNVRYFSESRLFKIFFNDDTGLSTNILSFSNCVLASDKTILQGYTYYFGTVDPLNGKITSD